METYRYLSSIKKKYGKIHIRIYKYKCRDFVQEVIYLYRLSKDLYVLCFSNFILLLSRGLTKLKGYPLMWTNQNR